jgi:Ca2+:H+ antiporter
VPRNGVNRAAGRRVLAWLDPGGQSWEIWFLVAVPIAIAAAVLELSAVARFLAAAVAIVPLAGLMGRSTEALAHRLGPGVGGLLNATFGNAAELILALLALRRGLDGVVKASLTGSIIGNLLLVLGASLLAGGVKYRTQVFNKTVAGSGSTLMVLASVGLLIPALFHAMVGPGEATLEHKLSLSVSVVLILTYGLNLLFNLVTHKDLFGKEEPEERPDLWGLRRSAAILLVATGFVAVMSEILVEAVEGAGKSLGMSEVFMGVIVVAIVGNAAEHSTAILMALKNQMDLAVGIALGSALQVALFVAPVLVFASYLRPGHRPMDLLFSTFEVVAVILAALLARMAAEDGESNWLEGAMLLMVYVILGLAFYFLPVGHAG